MAIFCNSHAQHFEFMGIPIDGSIEDFEAKLEAKGFVKSKDPREENTHYTRWYDGRFAGDDILLSVHNTKTNLVYATNVLQFFATLDDVKAKWEYYVSVIEDKYKDRIIDKTIQGTDDIRYKMDLGDICVFYDDDVNFKSYKYRLYLLYMDKKNTTIKNEMDKEDF